jgi:hypothetical protein
MVQISRGKQSKLYRERKRRWYAELRQSVDVSPDGPMEPIIQP